MWYEYTFSAEKCELRCTWPFYEGYSCFNLKSCMYGSEKYYRSRGYTVLQFNDFDWEDGPLQANTFDELLKLSEAEVQGKGG